MDKKKKNRYNDLQEDETKYGETIPSMFSWLTPSEQKKRAEELENVSKGTSFFDTNEK